MRDPMAQAYHGGAGGRPRGSEEQDAGNQQEEAQSPVDVDDEDDSELDCLLRRAMLLLRAKARGVKAPEPEEDEGDDELDQLLQRALLLLRQRSTKDVHLNGGRGEQVLEAAAASTVVEQDDDDNELDRLLRRAMLLFAERRRLSAPDSAATDASSTVATVSGSPSLTDGEDDDEEDDELDRLLRQVMTLLRRRLRVLANNQEPDGELEFSTPIVTPIDWRKALCLQQLDKLQTKKMLGSQKRHREDTQESVANRKTKRARCLLELQQAAEVVDVHTEAQATSPGSMSETHDKESIATAATTRLATATEVKIATVAVDQQLQQPATVNPVPIAERPRLVNAAEQTSREDSCDDDELLSLRASNEKLSEENSVLKQQLQDRASDARMVLLLQEQVQRLQQRELELMRALARA
ncbi:hypothetical protein PR003_g20276 [Phytophthora rubi]|uniref:Uncharacterized protein n=1 Tax=Phytophthora rubi TaxID=129364 RepID=A0A6A4E0A8_9STRA|nr:hypothetical protein PR003_g20276 [Phytophthora rubi]